MAVIAQNLNNPSQYVTLAVDDHAGGDDDDDDDDRDDYESDYEGDYDREDEEEYDVSKCQQVISRRYTATYDAGAIGTGLSLIGTHTSASNVFLNMTVSALQGYAAFTILVEAQYDSADVIKLMLT
jgi:hypothetical protein